MKIRFTEHAIERFIERKLGAWATASEAVQEMNRLVNCGTMLRERTDYGDKQLLSDGVVFVLKHDNADSVDCATILFDDRAELNPLVAEIERYGVMPNYEMGAPLQKRRKSRRSNRHG
jgi:hypothetical protein